MARVQFFKGAYENYSSLDASARESGIYFATDRPVIFAAGQEIAGMDGSIVETFEWVDASNALKVSYKDGSEKFVELPQVSKASEEEDGLMSKEDFAKLAAIDSSWFGEGHIQDDRIVWTADLEPYARLEDVSAGFVAKEEGKSLISDEELEKLEGIEEGAQVNLVDGIDENDKVLSLSDKKLSATLSIDYDSSSRKVQLKGIDAEVISEFDASEFVKDGFLYGTALVKASADGTAHAVVKDQETDFSGLEPNHQYLAFCFTDGAVVPSYTWQAVDVNELVSEYTAGDHVSIENHVISVVDMSTNVTKTTEAIIIAGGPLDSSAARALYPNGVIPAGTDMQALLTALFCKVIDGTVSASYSWNPLMNKPTVTLEGDGGVVEIGKSLSRNTALNNTGSGNTAKVTVTATQGYFKDDDTAYHSGDYVENVNGTFDFSGNVLTTKWNNGSILPGESTVIAALGPNKLEVSQSGATASVGEFAAATIYASTNTKDKLDASVSVDVDKYSATSPKSLAATSVTKTVTGVYPIFYGLNTAPTKAALADSTVFNDLQIVESGEDRASFSYPAGRTISVSVLNTLNNTYEPYAGEFAITDETRTINGVDYDYKLWKRVAGGNNGSNKYQITLSKKTSE